MIKFFYHKYQLVPKFALSAVAKDLSRDGALFKIQWSGDLIGYGDLFPWPEFGDDPLERQLEQLKKGRISRLMEQTIWLAKKDAQFRKDKVSGLVNTATIKNHLVIPDFTKLSDVILQDYKKQGFTTLKLKVGRDIDQECKWIEKIVRKHPYFTFRLDFNAVPDSNPFQRMLGRLSPSVKNRIEYVEDPFPYDYKNWMEVSKLMPLALDFEFDKVDWDEIKGSPPFKVLIIKPARNDVQRHLEIAQKYKLRFVVTSSMDHPVGMAHAMLVAGEVKKLYPAKLLECGGLSQHVYWPNEFTKEMVIKGPCLVQIKGHGIGFDELFKKTEWVAL